MKKKRPISKEKQLKRCKNYAHKLWRGCVLLKFGGKCVVCNATVLPNCHHIVSEKLFTYMRYDPDNGIILCPSHHKFNKFSAHKNAFWFIWVVLTQKVDGVVRNELMTKMLNCGTERFIWTIELYVEAISKLELRLKELKEKTYGNTEQVGEKNCSVGTPDNTP